MAARPSCAPPCRKSACRARPTSPSWRRSKTARTEPPPRRRVSDLLGYPPARSDMLNGKTALVTGSTSGIGLSIAQALAAQGCHVMLNGFGQAETIEAERAAIERAHGVKVDYSGADVSRPTEVHGLVT